MEQMIELAGLPRWAELAPNSIDPETRSVEVIWSTGAGCGAPRYSASRMTRSSAWRPSLSGSSG